MVKFFKRYVIEGKGVAYICTLIALLFRFGFFMSIDKVPEFEGGFLWNYLAPFLSDRYVSSIVAFLFTIGIALYVSHLDEKHNLIRTKTFLPYVFTILLLTFTPFFVFFSPSYFSIVFLLMSMDILYSSYQDKESAKYSFRIGFLLALGSLFTPPLLLWIPLFWVGFSLMRNIGFKAFLGSFVGPLLVYWLVACVLLFQGELVPYVKAFLLKISNPKTIDILQLDITYWIILGFSVLFVTVIMIYNFMIGFRDKVQVRANISFLNFIFIFSLLLFIFLSCCFEVSLMTCLTIVSLILAHHFALVTKKWEVCIFMGLIIFLSINYFYFLSNSH